MLRRPLIVVRNSAESPKSVESGFAHLVSRLDDRRPKARADPVSAD